MPKIVDQDARRRAIAEATWNVINDVGVERVTLMDIAKSAGFTTGSLVHYFRFKDEVIAFCYAESQKLVGNDISASYVGLSPGMERLRATLLGPLPVPSCAYKVANFRLCQWIPANAPVQLVRRYRKTYGQWRDLIIGHLHDAMAAQQIVKPDDVERDIDLLITFIDGVGFNMLADPKRAYIERETEFVDQMILRLLQWPAAAAVASVPTKGSGVASDIRQGRKSRRAVLKTGA